MSKNRSLLTALGPILGLLLVIYVIMQGVNYYQQGAAEFNELARQAGEPVLLSETLHEADAEHASESASESTEDTTEEAAVESDGESEASNEVAATVTTTDTATVATTEITATAELADTEPTTEPLTDTVMVAESANITDTESVTGTESITATTTETGNAEAAPAEAGSEAVAMAAPAPEEVTPIFTKAGCIGCHVIPNVTNAIGAVGPDLSKIGVDGATRIEGYTAAEYIRESILEPNALIASECPNGPCLPNLMVQNLGDILTAEEIDAVVAYLAAQGTE